MCVVEFVEYFAVEGHVRSVRSLTEINVVLLFASFSFSYQLNSPKILLHLGVGPGDKVALIANNRWEWAAIACAAYSMTAGIVPMYEAQLPSDWSYIINDSEAKILFCATQEIYDAVQKDVAPSAPTLQTTMCLDAAEGEPHAFATAMAGAEEDNDGKLIIEPTVDDLASLIYTSGEYSRRVLLLAHWDTSV